MKARTAMLAAIGLAAVALPGLAAAQPYPGYWGYPGYGDRGDYGGGDWRWRQQGFPGYPEFRGEEEHIRREIVEAVRDDMIERDDAADLFGDLRRIRVQEAREFSFHGWRLPDDDRRMIRAELDRLDHTVDQVRDEP